MSELDPYEPLSDFQREVCLYYYGLPVPIRDRMRWVLDESTLETLHHLSGWPDEWELDERIRLLGRPLRVDNAIEGFTHEVMS